MTPPQQPLLPGLRPFMRSYRPRPTRADVLPAAVERLVDRISAEWGAPDPRDREEWVASLLRVLSDALPGADGWSLCRDMERDGWDVDSFLVDVMDSASGVVDDVLRAAEGAWVEDTAMTLPLAVGCPVTVDIPRRGTVEGFIAARDPRRGTYTVRVPSLGHVERGLGVLGAVLPAEAVPGGVAYEPLPPP